MLCELETLNCLRACVCLCVRKREKRKSPMTAGLQQLEVQVKVGIEDVSLNGSAN